MKNSSVYRFIDFLMPTVRLYWRIAKPKTYGVKVLIVDDARRCLLVSHTYGDRGLWNIPGGGYVPKRETAFDAAKREVREELGVEPKQLHVLGTYQTDGEGKRDTVTMFLGTLPEQFNIAPSNEIAEYVWSEIGEVKNRNDVARVVRRAISAYEEPLMR